MKNRFYIQIAVATVLFLLANAGPLNAADEDIVSEDVHIVVKGDTLWDISEQHLENPFLWPRLWQWNDYISNPHFIYPGDNIRLYPPKVTVKRPKKVIIKKEPEAAPAKEVEEVEEAPPVEEEVYIYSPIQSSGLVSPEEMEAAGQILEAKDENVMLSTGDFVYVTLKDDGKEGDIYTVFKKKKKVIHPETKESLGYRVTTLGFIEITGLSGKLATARIIKAFDVINRGNLLTPKEDIPEKVTIRESGAEMEGFIVASKEDGEILGEGDIVYIDQGKNKGVETGNSFVIYKEGETVKDKKTKKKYLLPATTIGKLLVLYTKDKTSVAIITDSAEEMRVGERIKSEISR